VVREGIGMLLTLGLYTVRTGIIEPHARTLELPLLVRCPNRWLSYGENREFTGEISWIVFADDGNVLSSHRYCCPECIVLAGMQNDLYWRNGYWPMEWWNVQHGWGKE